MSNSHEVETQPPPAFAWTTVAALSHCALGQKQRLPYRADRAMLTVSSEERKNWSRSPPAGADVNAKRSNAELKLQFNLDFKLAPEKQLSNGPVWPGPRVMHHNLPPTA